jgi:hypothetical protein
MGGRGVEVEHGSNIDGRAGFTPPLWHRSAAG